MITALVDYDSGNLHSAQKAFERMAKELDAGRIVVTCEAEVVAKADRIVLPGDGAFPHCRDQLFGRSDLAEAIVEAVETRGVPFFGICVGMQMLATTGHEYTPTQGFGWIPGDIRAIAPDDSSLKVPHMGWNDLVVDQPHPILEGVNTGDHAYFVHSFAMELQNSSHLLAHVDYGGTVAALVGRDNIVGAQFHPEKSQDAGLRMIGNFLRWTP